MFKHTEVCEDANVHRSYVTSCSEHYGWIRDIDLEAHVTNIQHSDSDDPWTCYLDTQAIGSSCSIHYTSSALHVLVFMSAAVEFKGGDVQSAVETP